MLASKIFPYYYSRMTRPRTSTTRELFGIIGTISDVSSELSHWNNLFEKEGIDAFMDRYKTKESEIPERLSEMFHFDRRGYIVGDDLQEVIIPYLDEVEEGVSKIDTINNKGGILYGHYLSGDRQKRRELWFE